VAVGLDVTADGELLSLGVHGYLVPAFKCEGPQGPSPRVVDGLRPFFYLYFYCTKRSITTMPTIFIG
jgi:hypothetical protein